MKPDFSESRYFLRHMPVWTRGLIGLFAISTGGMTFFISRWIIRFSDANPLVAACVEELLKMLVPIVLVFAGLPRKRILSEGPGFHVGFQSGPVQEKSIMFAMGFSTVSAGAFAFCENIVYALSFPDAGILTRLWWTSPLHILCAIVATCGLFSLPFILTDRQRSLFPIIRKVAFSVSMFFLAVSIHVRANAFIESDPSLRTMIIVGMFPVPVLFVAFMFFSLRLYSGGIVHDRKET